MKKNDRIGFIFNLSLAERYPLFHFLTGSLVLFALLFFSFSCNSKDNKPNSSFGQKTTLNVATAANAQFAMKEIEAIYETLQDSINIQLVVSSSGKLTAQIQQGAPYDVFLSANMKYPDYLYREGFAKSLPMVYAQGGLVIWSKNLSLDTINWIDQLHGASKIAIANPGMAPYGEQAINFFMHYDLYDSLKDKLVYGESISQTNQYIISAACELGITAKSVVLSPSISERGTWVEVPRKAYKAIEQGLVITRYGMKEHSSQAEAFVEFLSSSSAKAILEKYGYIVPE